MPDQLLALPPNPRVSFLLANREDLQNWGGIPVYLGIILAPLYDHRPAPELTAIIIAILAVSWLWVRFFEQWLETRVGIFLPRAARQPKRSKFRSAAAIWGGLLLVAITIGVLRRHSQQYPADGWIEQAAGTWLCLAVGICTKRVFDPTNLRPRRLWNGIAAAVLLVGFSFLGTSPKSYAELLVLLGVCYLALALLDIGLLLHLAGTNVSDSRHAHV